MDPKLMTESVASVYFSKVWAKIKEERTIPENLIKIKEMVDMK
jgi:hypothetical protein